MSRNPFDGECHCECHRPGSTAVHCTPCCRTCPHCHKRIAYFYDEHVEACKEKCAEMLGVLMEGLDLTEEDMERYAEFSTVAASMRVLADRDRERRERFLEIVNKEFAAAGLPPVTMKKLQLHDDLADRGDDE